MAIKTKKTVRKTTKKVSAKMPKKNSKTPTKSRNGKSGRMGKTTTTKVKTLPKGNVADGVTAVAAESAASNSNGGAPSTVSDKKTENCNTPMGFARAISDTLSSYFNGINTAMGAFMVTLVLFSTMAGCTWVRGLPTESKGDIAYSAARAATTVWVVLDKKSTKYIEPMDEVVAHIKTVVNKIETDDPDVYKFIYTNCYAEIEKWIETTGYPDQQKLLCKSLAKFALYEAQKILKTIKAKTPEDAVFVLNRIMDGISDGLKVAVTTEEYTEALEAVSLHNEAVSVSAPLFKQKDTVITRNSNVK